MYLWCFDVKNHQIYNILGNKYIFVRLFIFIIVKLLFKKSIIFYFGLIS